MEKATTSITELGSAIYAARRAADIVGVLRSSGSLGEQDQVRSLNKILREYGEYSAVTVADLPSIRVVGSKLYALFETRNVEEEATLLNDLLREYGNHPRLTSHGGTAWHLHIDSSDHASWAEWLAASSALAFATLLAEKQRCPGGLCISSVCGRPFIDVGKGGGRSYCSPRCSTRERVAKYRAR